MGWDVAEGSEHRVGEEEVSQSMGNELLSCVCRQLSGATIDLLIL